MKIGMIGAMPEEILPLIERLGLKPYEKISMVQLYRGKVGKIEIFACTSGICKTNMAISTQVLIRESGCEQIILIGVSGALNPRLDIGDIVVAEALVHHDVSDEILTKFHPYMKESWIYADRRITEDVIESIQEEVKTYGVLRGRVATGEFFVHDERREEIVQNFNADCVDMESAAFAQVCYLNEIPFAVIRSMSDKANEDSHRSFKENYRMAALNSMDLIETYIFKCLTDEEPIGM
ncbi:5'-methylthioadenosine/adenosylhomocysteine nucleosidase [Filifactor villosus]|uniref:adenosylhomocysteine nucleosidase n=1 Tax=Filifactor villosus TaxID=29374 RepID=A0ABV9QSR0_9FIRM